MRFLFPPFAAVFALLAFSAPAARALDGAAEGAERARISAERDKAEAAFVERERECRQRFFVTACLDQARRDRRQSMEQLRQQQEVLDETQRKQRAAQRIDEIQNKVSGDDAKQRETAARERSKQRPGVEAAAASAGQAATEPAAAASSASTRSAASREAHAAASRPASRVDEAKHEADYERRQQEAQEHRKAVERRNAEHAASGKAPAKGLPIPAGASAAH